MADIRTALRGRFLTGPMEDRIQIWLATLLQLLIIPVAVVSLAHGRWLVAFTAVVVLGLTFVPALIERSLGVLLPVEFTLATSVFLYGSFALGEVSRFYERFWWWDLLLHSGSAMVLGISGFLAVYVFYMTHRVRVAPIYVAIISFSFAVSLGALWEIFEFTMDWFFHTNMQKSGLVDTMTDLMVDVGGALIAAVSGYFYVKDGDSLLVDRFVTRLVQRNPQLFRWPRRHQPRG